jgi:hypothetical protein
MVNPAFLRRPQRKASRLSTERIAAEKETASFLTILADTGTSEGTPTQSVPPTSMLRSEKILDNFLVFENLI